MFNKDIAAFWTEPDFAPIIAPGSSVIISSASFEEISEIQWKNGVNFAMTTRVVIFWYERDNFRDRHHIGLEESAIPIVPQKTASVRFTRNITNHPYTKQRFLQYQ